MGKRWKQSNDWIFLKPFYKPCFNQLRCHGNNTHPSQNARMSTSVVNLESCKNWRQKGKYFKSNGELGTSTWKLCSATLNSHYKLPVLCFHFAHWKQLNTTVRTFNFYFGLFVTISLVTFLQLKQFMMNVIQTINLSKIKQDNTCYL